MGDTTVTDLPHAEVRRFWCAPVETYSIDDDGFLSDPEEVGFGGRSRNPSVVPTESLAEHRCVVLLGEPGVGKTRVLAGFTPVTQEHVSVLRIDLASYSSEARVIRDVFERDEIARWREGNEAMALVLDAFDEAQRRVPTLPLITRDYVRDFPTERLHLRIACRTAEWPKTLAKALDDAFASVVTVELLPLRRRDVALFLPSTFDSEQFLDAVDEVHAGPLAARPLTLRMLIGAYAADGSLPARGAALYERGALTLCDEHNDARRDTGLTGALTPAERLAVAGRIAACTTFGARTTVSLAAAGTPPDPEHLSADSLVGGTERTAIGTVDVDRASMTETLETGLFSGRGLDRVGWTHATFPDFLAARWLISNSLDDEQVRSLLMAVDGLLFPQVRRVAAWLVAIDPERFAWLTTLDPESFLSEIDVPDDALRRGVVEALFGLAEAGALHHEFGRSFKGLRHPALVEQIRAHLTTESEEVRRLAIDLAGHCAVDDALPDLVKVAFDQSVIDYNRVAAAWVVHDLTENDRGDHLARLARDPVARGADPDDELKGVALLASWPHAIPTTEAFTLLDVKHSRNLYGIHRLFLDRLAESLTASDLHAAIGWLAGLGDQVDDRRLEPLVRGVLQLAVDHLDDSEALKAVVALARRRAAKYEPLLGDDIDDVDLKLTQEARRRLVTELLPDADDNLLIQMTDSLGGHGLGLIRSDDLPWLAAMYDERDDLRAALARVVQWVVRLDDATHVNFLLERPEGSPFFVDVVTPWVEPIRLDSPKAAELRKQWRLLTKRRRERTPTKTDREVEQLLDADLAAIRSGEVHRFWHVARLVKVRPGSKYYNEEFQPDLTQHPRWAELSDTDRATIVDAAAEYVRTARCEPQKWLGADKRYFPAEAGYQALLLLLRLRPDELTRLDGEVWREWAPILISWTTTANGASWDDKRVLLTYARPHAESELTNALVAVVRAAAQDDDHLFYREECRFLWSDALATELLTIATQTPTPKALADLLSLLASESAETVRPVLLEWITAEAATADRDRALVAARLLLRHDATTSWDALRARITEDPEFGDDLVLGYDAAHDRTPPRLPPAQLGEFYLWLVERFPPSDDPTFDDAHWVGPREALGRWRDAILDHLRALGTPDAVDAVRMIAMARPEIAGHRRSLVAAQDALRANLWHPLSPPDLIRLASEHATRLVYDEAALLRLVHEALDSIQRTLQEQTPDAHLLWDTVANHPVVRRPKAEDEISNYLRNRLKERIGGRGVVVNREVQVRPTTRSGIGERTDLHIDAVTDSTSGARPTITIVGEVKGAWHNEVDTAMQSQLVDRYMRDAGSRHGVFVVAWFDRESWDQEDDRRERVPGDIGSLRKRLEQQATELRETRGIVVDVVVLDFSYRRPPEDIGGAE